MADGGGEIDLVSDIIKNPFSMRTFPEKIEIVRRGRPTPKLASLSQPGKGFVRHFQTSAYERYHWLTASEERCKLYCWECLLFASDRRGVWSHRGFANLSCLTKAAVRHQATGGHLQAAVLLRTFGDVRVDLQVSEQVRRETELYNEKVKKNREILKRLIDCVIFLGKQELSFRGHDESSGATNRGNYMELLSFLAENNADLHYHLSTNKVFCGTSGRIQNDLINAIGDVMGEEIKKEVHKAPFVTVMVNEMTDVSNAVQLALVLRYVTEASVKERFITYEDVTSGRRTDDIATLIVRFLEEYECLDKVVAQCFDGTAVMSSGLNEVQAKIKERAPMALFIHCYAHRLNLVLTQGVSKLKECKIFFAHLNGLAAFFSRSPKPTQLLDDFCQRRLPRVAPAHWQYTSRLVSTVFEKRDALKEVFNHILEHHDEYDEESVRYADGFNTHLDDFEFCFMLHTFNGIFEHCDVLFAILQNNPLDVQLCLARVKEFCDTIERERARFDAIYVSTVSISGALSAQRGPAQGDIRTHYQQLHNSILDNILCQIQNRFQDYKQLMFLSLLDHQQFQTYRMKFPHTAFSSLMQSHGTLFDLSCLKTELTVMYAMTDFEGKCPTDLLDFLHQKNLSESMPQLYRLACLILTIPISIATVERTFSAFKRIKTYARNMTGESRLAALASMAIEKDLLMELKRKDHLYDRVIEVFLRKEKRMDILSINNQNLWKNPDQNWLQCDQCMNWRTLPDGIDLSQLPDKWFCYMNPDPQFRTCTVEEETVDSDDEQPRNQKTYKQYEKNQRLQKEKNRQQRLFHGTSDSPFNSRSQRHAGSSSQVLSPSSISTRKKRPMGPSQENEEMKRARIRDCFDTPSRPSTSTASHEFCSSPILDNPDGEGDQAAWKDNETAFPLGYITVKLEEEDTEIKEKEKWSTDGEHDSNLFAHTQVESIKNEHCTLLTSCESLKKALQEIKRESEKSKVFSEDQVLQTNFPISSHEESRATSAEASNSGRGTDNNNLQKYKLKLRELRQTLARLLVTLAPDLDLQQLNYDCDVIDELLVQVVNEISPAETAST